MTPSTLILSEAEIKNKIRRMAFQVYESNLTEEEIVIAGIAQSGYTLAQKLKDAIESISSISVSLCKVTIDKQNPIGSVSSDMQIEEYKEKSIVLVDDVLNSGSTLIYAVHYFLNCPLKQFKTAVLVNRNHKKFPVKADFKGISLSTSINENVVVSFQPKMKVTLE